MVAVTPPPESALLGAVRCCTSGGDRACSGSLLVEYEPEPPEEETEGEEEEEVGEVEEVEEARVVGSAAKTTAKRAARSVRRSAEHPAVVGGEREEEITKRVMLAVAAGAGR